ncbi:hypothetical protein A0U91_15530 (plasmid) [Acetobacter persici]|uniref:Endonuclease n=2 Tax=Acetobacter persici TaxID=1076596 RepID=A0A1U9LIZ1_9PROT|nr:hypothetical protein A0U91_15530 [Acetobacter persici]
MKKATFALLYGTAIAACYLLSPETGLADDFAACPDHFQGGSAPQITRDAMSRDTFPLCYQGFAVLYSGVSYTPLWSAEHLTEEHVDAASAIRRVNAFHPESKIPDEFRSELSDYTRTGYDRGHMTPSGDEWTREAQQETYTLANMIPQNPDNNRNLWEGIEASIRELAEDEGELYVVTGPVFTKKLHVGRLLVPTMIFKAVYSPSQHKAAAYLVANGPGRAWTQVPIPYLVTLSGVNPFPTLPDEETNNELPLPWPKPHGDRHGIQPGQVSPDNGGIPGEASGKKEEDLQSADLIGSRRSPASTIASGETEAKYGVILLMADIMKKEAKKEFLKLGKSALDYVQKHYQSGASIFHNPTSKE